jgi:MFS family permease
MPGISRTTTLIFAIAAGVAVANIYYLQPILAVIATDLHATPRTVGFVAMALQIGYALGILAFVPLGDIVQRRGLIVGLFGLAAVYRLRRTWRCQANVGASSARFRSG